MDIKVGLTNKKEQTVTEDRTAKYIGSGGLEVFSTPHMIALFELTAKDLIDPLVEDNQSSVGMEISMKHLKATALGKKVWCEVEIDKVEGRKIHFIGNCFDEDGKIGEGHHYRFVVDNEKFLKKIYG